MNNVTLTGRLTRKTEVRYGGQDNSTAIARFTLAVDRAVAKGKTEGTADFVSIVAFNKRAEFAEKYLRKGSKIAIEGRLQTGSYTTKDGAKIYTTDVIVDNCEFAGAKPADTETKPASVTSDGFMDIPDGLDADLPFN